VSALDVLIQESVPPRFATFSALDRYFRIADPRTGGPPSLYFFVSADLIQLAKLFPDLRYPGIEGIDAALSREGEPTAYFRCMDSNNSKETRQPFDPLHLLYDPVRDSFQDPQAIYPSLRLSVLRPSEDACRTSWIPSAAVMISRYPYRLESPPPIWQDGALPAEKQRDILLQVITGKTPQAGLKLLMESGFIAAHWPELDRMRDVSHSKEYHPEGDAWDHTMETFRYRKNMNIPVSLALLLHDTGKPLAEAAEGRRFDKHAEIGTGIAEKFLRRLEFPPSLIRDVLYLVKNHMLPGALKLLPVYRVEGIMKSDLFPLLLEVYRCDLSSTFRGPDSYYTACKVYRAFLKNSKNPFRTTEGKKIQYLREYVER